MSEQLSLPGLDVWADVQAPDAEDPVDWLAAQCVAGREPEAVRAEYQDRYCFGVAAEGLEHRLAQDWYRAQHRLAIWAAANSHQLHLQLLGEATRCAHKAQQRAVESRDFAQAGKLYADLSERFAKLDPKVLCDSRPQALHALCLELARSAERIPDAARAALRRALDYEG